MADDLIRGAIARGWCSPENAHKEMDVVLAEAIVKEVAVLPAATPTLSEALKVPEIAALVEAVKRVHEVRENQFRTADYYGDGCKCWRCAEDAMFAALRAIGGAR